MIPPAKAIPQLKHFLAQDLGLDTPTIYWLVEELRRYIPQVNLETEVQNRIGAQIYGPYRSQFFEDPNMNVQPAKIKETRTRWVLNKSWRAGFWARLRFLFQANVAALDPIIHLQYYQVEIDNPMTSPLPSKSITLLHDYTTYGFRNPRCEIRLRCAYVAHEDLLVIVNARKDETGSY